MSTHAEEVARLRDAVVEAAKEVAAAYREVGPDGRIVLITEALVRADDALRAAEQAVCGKCGATGGKWITTVCGDDELADFVACPACHGTGRKPDKEEANG